MTFINHLYIQSFRNLKTCKLYASSEYNVLVGNNGAGKTSILEAIYVLSHQSSLRCARLESAIQFQSPSFVLSAQLTQGTQMHHLGMEKTPTYKRIRLNEEDISGRKKTLSLLPVIWIGPDSFRHWLESPDDRRGFLDWGLFHVEHEFLSHYQHYKRAFQQRNRLLKQNAPNALFAPWEALMDTHGTILHQHRVHYAKILMPLWQKHWEALGGAHQIAVQWKEGWDLTKSLRQALEEGRHKERFQGITLYGPQRAQWTLTIEGQNVTQILSRGQMKALILAMWLAQAEQVLSAQGKQAIILADDLPSELDESIRGRVWQALSALPHQKWLTGLEAEDFPPDFQERAHMFHVEHGTVRTLASSVA